MLKARTYLLGAPLLVFALAACSVPAPATLIPSSPTPAFALTPSPEPPPWASPRFAAPLMPADPAQADLGAMDYYLICMACHADRGQGLTDEWRAAWGEDSDCWQSRCHASNHPPDGFDLPRTSPAVRGAGSLMAYTTAWELYRRIAETMPWWKPGSLTDEQAMNLTAYLMRTRDELPARMVLDEGNLRILRLHQAAASQPDDRPGALLLIGLLATAVVVMLPRRAP